MHKKSAKTHNSKILDIKCFPIESSLGHLAYGDIAFRTWRELKKTNNKKTNE